MRVRSKEGGTFTAELSSTKRARRALSGGERLEMAEKKKFVPVLAVLNMKGGVGKTTISAHVLRVLFEQKKAGTLLIDLDPQFNLTQALFSRSDYDKIKAAGDTVSTVMEPPSDIGLFDVKTSGLPPPSASVLAQHIYIYSESEPIPLDIIPGDFSMVKYSLMDDHKKLSSVRDRFRSFIKAARQSYDLVAIDCNPSSSFLTMCALQVCTHILSPVRPDRYSVLGLEILREFVEGVSSISPKPQFIVLLNGIPRSGGGADVQAIENELRSHDFFGARTMVKVVPDSSLLRAKTDYTGFATDRGGPWTGVLKKDITAVANELASKLGLK